MKKILFLHGLESQPGGSKPRFLKEKGYHVLNPNLPKSSFEESIKIAQDQVDSEEPDIIVGSSRGGAVAMCLDPRDAKLVLIAPAWKNFTHSQDKEVPSTSMILHSMLDDVVDYEDSVELSTSTGAYLMEVGESHRMNDNDALEGLVEAVEWATQ